MGTPRSRLLVGAWLVVWGLVLLLVSNHVLIGWDNLWPCILIVSGVVMLRVFQNRLKYSVVFAASWAILLGGFFTAFSTGLLPWGQMRTLWPIIPLIIGASFIVAAATVRGPNTNAGSVVGALVIFMSAASYLYEIGTISERVAAPFLRYWPLVLVLAGFVLMRRDVARSTAARAAAGGAASTRSSAFDVGALSTDLEKEILRRVRSARGAHDAAMALVRELKSRFERFSWVGIYRLQGDTLTLDETEFVGAPPEHRRIPLSEGVCGAAASARETIIVPDVCADDRYLACSPTVKSEIVVPILAGGDLIGVLDIDSDEPDAFSDDDRRFLEALLAKTSPLIRDASVTAA